MFFMGGVDGGGGGGSGRVEWRGNEPNGKVENYTRKGFKKLDALLCDWSF